MNKKTETAIALDDVRDQILDLMEEAEELVAGTSEEASAGSYWIPHIRTALGSDSYRTYSPTMRDSVDAFGNRCTECGDGLEETDDDLCGECA